MNSSSVYIFVVLFLYLSTDVDSPCIIAVVDFVRDMHFFLSFAGILSFLPFVPPSAFIGR